jgi:transposase
MTIYAGLDVSDKTTHVCVVDAEGAIVWRGVCATDPEEIAKTLRRHARGLVRVVFETGSLSAFLYHGLIERDVPAICICARHAKGALSARVNKSDPHDAEGLGQMARTGWFKAVRIKQEGTHLDRAQLKIREQLTGSRLAMTNQLRGLLKLFGLRMGKVTTPAKRAERLAALFAQKPEIKEIMMPLVESIEALDAQLKRSGKLLAARAAADPVTARLMTVPSVGPIAALAFKSSIEDPGRVARGEDVGAYGPHESTTFVGALCRARPQTQPVGRARLQGPHLQSRRCDAAFGALRSGQCPARARQTALCAPDLGQEAGRDQRPQASARRRRPQARHPASPPLAIGNRVLLELITPAAPRPKAKTGRSRL